MQQLELFHDDLSLLAIAGTRFRIDHLHCVVEDYDCEANSVDFYVNNGCWRGLLKLNHKEVYIYATFTNKSVDFIGNVKPPLPSPQGDEIAF